MGRVTLIPGPGLIYVAYFDEDRIREHLARYGELPEGEHLPQEEHVTTEAHEYLFEPIRRLDSNVTLGDIVLLADGNPYLLGIYGRQGAVHLVTETLRLRAMQEASSPIAMEVLIARRSYGLVMDAVLAPDADGHSLQVEAFEEHFASMHGSPIRFSERPAEIPEMMLGELLDLVFMYFGPAAQRLSLSAVRAGDGSDGGADFEDHEGWDSYEERLADLDSERGEIAAEFESDRDDWARTQDSGWHED